jgi:hypothetical protein
MIVIDDRREAAHLDEEHQTRKKETAHVGIDARCIFAPE